MMQTMKSLRSVFLLLLLTAGCSRHNNLLLGRVETHVAGHRVMVTDCYRTSVPASEQIHADVWRWMPCRDADIVFDHEMLTVNGISYGRINSSDGVIVDHGSVSIARN
jgi:hypothetical protein